METSATFGRLVANATLLVVTALTCNLLMLTAGSGPALALRLDLPPNATLVTGPTLADMAKHSLITAKPHRFVK